MFTSIELILDKKKYGYKIELEKPETMKLFGTIKKLIGKIKIRKNVASLTVVEVVLFEYQQTSEFLYTFMPNKYYVCLLNVEPRNLVFLKTYNKDFDEIIITFKDKNGRPLEIGSKVILTLLINK